MNSRTIKLVLLASALASSARAVSNNPQPTPAYPPQQWVWANPGGIWQWIAAALYHPNEGPHSSSRR